MEVFPGLLEDSSNELSLRSVPGAQVQKHLARKTRLESEYHTVPFPIRQAGCRQSFLEHRDGVHAVSVDLMMKIEAVQSEREAWSSAPVCRSMA